MFDLLYFHLFQILIAAFLRLVICHCCTTATVVFFLHSLFLAFYLISSSSVILGSLFRQSSRLSSGANTIKKNTNSTQNKSQTHRAKQYEVTSFLSTDCELSTETCSKNVYSLGAPGLPPFLGPPCFCVL